MSEGKLVYKYQDQDRVRFLLSPVHAPPLQFNRIVFAQPNPLPFKGLLLKSLAMLFLTLIFLLNFFYSQVQHSHSSSSVFQLI